MIYCNNIKCKFNNDMLCMADNIGIVDRNCISSKKKPRDDNFRELMQAPFNPHCSKSSGKYKASTVNVLK